jgi:hypothetical protein
MRLTAQRAARMAIHTRSDCHLPGIIAGRRPPGM